MSNTREICWNPETGLIPTKDCNICTAPSSTPLSTESRVILTNPEHLSVLLEGLSEQRAKGKYLDTIIRVDSLAIPVHRCVLTTFSDYVDNLFRYAHHPLLQQPELDQLPSTKPQHSVNLHHLSPVAVQALIDAAYGADMITTSDQFSEVLAAVEFLCVSSVSKISAGESIEFNSTGYWHKLLKDLQEERQSGESVDGVITIAIGPLKISAHQSVLAAVCEYFEYLTNWKDIEADDRFQSLHPASVEALVEYAYTGTITILSCTIHKLLQAADYLSCDSLSNLCYEYIHSCLNADNCLVMHEWFYQSNNERLIRDAKRYILHNFYAVCQSESFLILDVDTLLEFLEDDELTMMKLCPYENTTQKYFFIPPSEQEEILLRHVVRYLRHNSYENYEDLPRLLARGVRLPLIDLLILSQLKDTMFYASCQDCRQIVDQAIKCHQENADKTIKLSENYSAHWTTPRTMTRLGFCAMERPERDLYPPSTNQRVPFDDSSNFNLPVQYVTGMQIYARIYNNKAILSGLNVTYNDQESILHGTSESSGSIASFDFEDPDERIIGIRQAMYSPDSHLTNMFSIMTNRKLNAGFITVEGSNEVMMRPEDSLYLAYLTGSVDVLDDEITLRDVEFIWAVDKQSGK